MVMDIGDFDESLTEWIFNAAKEYSENEGFSMDDASIDWLRRLVRICVKNVSKDKEFDIGDEFLTKFGEFFLKAFISLARPYPKRVWAKINNCFLTIFPCRLTFLVIFEIPITKNGPNLYIRDTLVLFIQITKFLKSSSNKFLRIF